MLHKIQLFFLFSFLFISFLSAQDNETFAGMACKFISHNRAVLHCELQQKQTLVIQTSDGKELKLLCLWLPQTREEESTDRLWANSRKSSVLLLPADKENRDNSKNR